MKARLIVKEFKQSKTVVVCTDEGYTICEFKNAAVWIGSSWDAPCIISVPKGDTITTIFYAKYEVIETEQNIEKDGNK